MESYIRARDSPFFYGMRRGDAPTIMRSAFSNFQRKAASSGDSTSISAVCNEGIVDLSDDSLDVTHITTKDSPANATKEPFGLSSTRRWFKEMNITPALPLHSDFKKEFLEEDELLNESSPPAYEPNEACLSLCVITRPPIRKTYSVKKKRVNFSRISLPPSAASFYNGHSQQMEIVETCESIHRLNLFLKNRRDEVNAGVPGKFLHTVLGQDTCDVGSIASTIMYAFYLNETLKCDQLCTLPVINVKRVDMDSHSELKWLLDSCQIDQSSLFFVDEIDLSYYDLYGSLKLVLLNGDRIPAKQEPLKESLIEILTSKKGDCLYPSVTTLTTGQAYSCCTMISEKFALYAPEMLASQGFSRLLLSGILWDTLNLTNPQCMSDDKYMATLLLNGAGRFGCNGLYQILRQKMYDVSDLKVGEILRKDFKKWTRIGKSDSMTSKLVVSHLGMSSIGIPIKQFLTHDETSTEETINFQRMQKMV